MPDSARHVLQRARTSDPAIDPRGELLGYEAFVRAQPELETRLEVEAILGAMDKDTDKSN